MTRTATRKELRWRDLIGLASNGQLWVVVKSLLAILALVTAFGLAIKYATAAQHPLSEVARPDVRLGSAAVRLPSSCSGGYVLTSIWLAIGCASSLEHPRRP
jgi:hypothetical protein